MMRYSVRTNTAANSILWDREHEYLYGREARMQRLRQKRRRKALKKRLCSIAAVLLLGLFLGIALTGFSRITATKAPAYKYYTAVTVFRDDTLWEIAQTHLPDEYTSVKAYIKEIKEINNMKSNSVYYGQKLILPYYSDTIK